MTLKMTNAKVVETSVIINNKSPIQYYVHPKDHTQPTYDSFSVSHQIGRLFKADFHKR